MLLVDQDFLPQATAMVEMAHHQIDIATFKAEITSKSRGRRLRIFFEKLFEKKANGVQIRFLINCHDDRRLVPLTNFATIKEMKQHKIEIRKLPGNRCCHAKILLVDKKRAIIGSHNLSIKSCHNNFEVSYLLSDNVSINRLINVFEETYNNAQPA